jgi:hypothetical protein
MKFISYLACFTLAICSAIYAEPVELQLENGTTWSGEIGEVVTVNINSKNGTKTIEGAITRATNSYIVVDTEFIFIDKIISISGGSDNKEEEETPDNTNPSIKQDVTDDSSNTKKPIGTKGELPKGVFLLPMHEMVGTYFRPTEITKLVDYIDENYGPGQIIVMEINSGGGSVKKWSELRDVVFEARKRHRFIAWITHAISGAAATGFLCDEVYYKTQGELGSITMYSGDINNVAPDWQLYGWIRELAGVLAKTSHTPLVAGCMVKVKENFSYDKDPVTGKITYYANANGEVVLSKPGRNLTLGAQEALDSGLCDGIADTKDDLAKFLDLDEWVEIDQYGVEIAEKWWATLKEFEEEGPKLRSQLDGDVQGNTLKKRLANRIKAGKELLSWAKKLGETAEFMGLNEDNLDMLKRHIKDLEHQKQRADD